MVQLGCSNVAISAWPSGFVHVDQPAVDIAQAHVGVTVDVVFSHRVRVTDWT